MKDTVSEALLQILMPLVEAEREAEGLQSAEDYAAFRERHAVLNARVLAALKAEVETRETLSLADLQDLYRLVVAHPALRGSVSDQAVAGAVLSEAWQGLKGWRR